MTAHAQFCTITVNLMVEAIGLKLMGHVLNISLLDCLNTTMEGEPYMQYFDDTFETSEKKSAK